MAEPKGQGWLVRHKPPDGKDRNSILFNYLQNNKMSIQ